MQVRRRLAGTITLIAMFSAIPAVQAQARPQEDAPSNFETSVTETLEANPGSVRLGEDDVLLASGVMWTVPNGDTGSRALRDCPSGWLCGWTHADYAGGRMAVREGVYVHFLNWYWDANDYRVKECPVGFCELGPGNWRPLSNSITSVFNNTWNVVWAPFYSPRNGANYYAFRGAPAPYVDAKWNDSFTEMCACP